MNSIATPLLTTLRNGPCDNKRVEDLGRPVIKIAIASKWIRTENGPRPARGAKTGVAIYEPSKDRTEAFWLSNEWHGTVEGNVEAV